MKPRPVRPERLSTIPILAALLGACAVLPDEERLDAYDADDDGWDFVDDCDGDDPEVYPGQDDLVGDDLDQNCDGVDGLDGDGDGWASEGSGGEDCDDEDASSFPGALELCGDGLVNDCRGSSGESQEACVPSGELALARSDMVFEGEVGGDGVGSTVAGLGRVEGAEADDFAVGAPYATVAGTTYAGLVYVMFGPASSDQALEEAGLIVRGVSSYELLGSALGGRGDVDGDAYPDLLIGAPSAMDSGGTVTGAAYLLLHPSPGSLESSEADVTLTGAVEYDFAGQAVGMAGDVDDDGYDDLLVGAPHHDSGGDNAGAAYIVLGRAELADREASLAEADLTMIVDNNAAYLGRALHGGDLDGSGRSDLVIGAPEPNSDAPGTVYIVMDPDLGSSLVSIEDVAQGLPGEANRDQAGSSLDVAGDVDHDGYLDVLVGAPGEDAAGADAGAVYLLLGGARPGWLVTFVATGGLSGADAKIIGARAGDGAGSSVAATGDLDGDDRDDIVIGAPEASDGADGAGAAYLGISPIEGTSSIEELRATFIGELAGERAGAAVAGAGDADGNGFADILIGAPGTAAVSAGRAYLVLNGY